jgi:plastocyanin
VKWTNDEVVLLMRARIAFMAVIFAAVTLGAGAQDVTGTILIKRKLTRRSVTPSVSVYQRGTAVKLGKDANEDPLAFERSRVVVYLEGAQPASQDGAAPVEIKQADRRFVPDLVVVPVGTTISFPNMDPIFHNIYSLSKPKSFDLGAYDKGDTRKVTFPKPGIVEIYCHLHPNMAATVVVTPNRWYARPDASGQYKIAQVPPGKYTLVAWHKSAGFFRKSIVIEPGQGATVDFFIPLDADAAANAAADAAKTAGAATEGSR